MMCVLENNEEYSLAQGSEMEVKIWAYNIGFVDDQNTC